MEIEAMDELVILFEDDHFVAINKPSNRLVHHSKYARNITEESLCQMVSRKWANPPHPVHRLDRKTSGVILFAKDKTLIPLLQKQFDEHTIEKEYIALIRGYINESGQLDYQIKADGKTDYKAALTHYTLLHSIEVDIPVQPYAKARYSLVKLSPKTGRMHQLRKHMNKFSHPIIGDPKYGNRHHNHMFIEVLNISNLFLHAKSLTFFHPVTKKELTIKADFPQFWSRMLTHFNWGFDLNQF